MAINKKISALNPLGVANEFDVFAIVDVSATETKKISKSDLMTTPGPIGSGSASTGEFSVLTLGGDPVNEFSTDGTLIGDSDSAVPTEQAVKTYVDTAVANAVSLNIIHTSLDSTAVIGDVLIVDTSLGNVNIELQASGEGTVLLIHATTDVNFINISTSSGLIYEGTIGGTPTDSMNFFSSHEYLCDGVNFYMI